MAAAPQNRGRKRRQPQQTEASRALVRARRLARLQIKHVAGALGVHPRTVTRWERGATIPSKEQWGKAVGYLARFVPAEAAALARAAGVASPVAEAPAVDMRAIEHGLLRAADLLDISPRRVRAAVRELAKITASAHGSLADLARASEEPAEPTPLVLKPMPLSSRGAREKFQGAVARASEGSREEEGGEEGRASEYAHCASLEGNGSSPSPETLSRGSEACQRAGVADLVSPADGGESGLAGEFARAGLGRGQEEKGQGPQTDRDADGPREGILAV